MADGAKLRADWHCRSCVHKCTGAKLVNWGSSLKCHGCSLHKKDVFGGNVPAAGGPSTRLKSGSSGGGGDAPSGAMAPRTKLERALQEARAEIDKLKKQHKQQPTATGNNAAVDMLVDGTHE
eukprot:383495-Pyramimonas_sp.AAC.1